MTEDTNLRPAESTVYREVQGPFGVRKLVSEKLEESTITPMQRAYVWALDIFSVKPTITANVLDLLQTAGLVIPAYAGAYWLGLGGMWVAGMLVAAFASFVLLYFGALVAGHMPLGWTYFVMRLFIILVIASLLFV